MNAPILSVLMPVYNVDGFLREAMDSILTQTFADFECIVVDDCSTDGTVAIVQEVAERDARIRLVHTPQNMGHTGALNVGLEEVHGEYIARMDGDDVALPTRFERQVEYMQSHPECVALGTQVDFIDEDGDFLITLKRALDHEGIEARLMRGDCLAIVHPSAMFRRDAVMGIGKYDPLLKKGEDHDLYLRLGEVGGLANLPDVLLKMRRHPSSTTALSTREEMVERTRKTIRRARVRRGLPEGPIELDDFPQYGSAAEWHADWALSLYKRGESRRVARKHARQALRCGPLTRAAWRAMYYAYVRYFLEVEDSE